MKTTNILQSAMVVIAIAFSFNACDEPTYNPDETSTTVVVTATITENVARFSNVRLCENGVAIKTLSLENLECTVRRAVKDCPDAMHYCLEGEYNGAPIDTDSLYIFGYDAFYSFISETAADEEESYEPFRLVSETSTVEGKNIENFIKAFYPCELGTVRLTY